MRIQDLIIGSNLLIEDKIIVVTHLNNEFISFSFNKSDFRNPYLSISDNRISLIEIGYGVLISVNGIELKESGFNYEDLYFEYNGVTETYWCEQLKKDVKYLHELQMLIWLFKKKLIKIF